EQTQEIAALRHKDELSNSRGGKGANLGEELRRLEGMWRVSEKYRGAAEAASEQLKLVKEVQGLREENQQVCEQLSKLQVTQGESMATIAELEARNELLAGEVESLRKILEDSEAKVAALEDEKETLISRTLDDKMKLLEEVNRMNAELEALRHQGTQAQLGTETGQPGSFDKAGLGLDQVPSCVRMTLPAHVSEINDVCYSPTGDLLGTASENGCIKVFDAASGQQRQQLSCPQGTSVSAMGLAFCGDLVAAGCSDNSCRVWNHRTSRERAHFRGHQQKVCCVQFAQGGAHVISGSHDCSIKDWDINRQFTANAKLMRAGSKCNSLDVLSDVTVISGHMDGQLRVWDLRAASLQHTVKGLHEDQITSVSCIGRGGGSGHVVLTNSRDNTLKLVDLRAYATLNVLSHPRYRTPFNFSRACASPSGTHVAAASGDRVVYIWEVSSGRVCAELESHEACCVSCTWSPSPGPPRLTAPSNTACKCLLILLNQPILHMNWLAVCGSFLAPCP
ncbi:unnamed protein product, partial [Chrysoparadoxa australica]